MNVRTLVLGLAVLVATALNSFLAYADPQLDSLIKNPSNWAAQAGDYSNHRYSTLKQINESNVGKLQVAWTMSTGVLRGHEGSPLVIARLSCGGRFEACLCPFRNPPPPHPRKAFRQRRAPR